MRHEPACLPGRCGVDLEEADTGLTGVPLVVTLNSTPQTVFVVLVDTSVWQSTDGATT